MASCSSETSLLPNAHEVRFEIVPGGHLGMLTGRAARTTTWPIMDEWIEQWSTPDQAGPQKKAESTPKAAAPPRPAAKKSPARTAPSRSAIGSNRDRRYSSAGSRNLNRKAGG